MTPDASSLTSLDRPYAHPSAEVVRALHSSPSGLSSADAEQRRAQVGPNRLPERAERPVLLRLLSHFHNILIYILLGSAVLKAVYRDWLDFWVIVAVAVITALVGFLQEGQAERALAGIRKLLSVSARVRRDGHWIEVPGEDLVPGDVVRIRAGDKVPADVRLFSAVQLEIDESALTGESVPAAKDTEPAPRTAGVGDRTGMAFSGTLVTRGTGEGVVTATGADTEIGHIQTLITQAEPLTTPLTRQLNKLSTRIAIAILVTAAFMTVAGLLLHGDDPKTLLDSAITFAVAAVPEGLPAIVTITLALGVQQMAKRSAITRKLTAVETLGEVTTICSDKTGTLTLNEMTVRMIVTTADRYAISGEGYRPEGAATRASDGSPASLADAADLAALVTAMARCNDAALRHEDGTWTIVGAPTEGSLVVLARKLAFDPAGRTRIAELPFDSSRKFMAVLDREADGTRRLIAKGAPDRLLERCRTQAAAGGGTEPLDVPHWHRVISELGRQGLRVLAAAEAPAGGSDVVSADDVRDLVFLGVVGIADPPRPEAIEAIGICRRAGIRVTMITGDHAATAAAIGADLGLSVGAAPYVVTGAEVDAMSDKDLADIAPAVDVFARTSPEHKIRVVRALQSRHQVVAMTGDGVNDAPALTRADIGIAMGITGTEVTKDAADIVLADDDFATIERAVAEGRRIFDNIQKSLMFILPTTFAQALVVLAAVLVGFVPPLQPTQVLWVNLVTAITLSLALAYEPAERGIMARPPRAPSRPVIDTVLLPRIVWVTLLIAAASTGVFFAQLNAGASLELARTTAVTMLVAGQVVYLLNTRFLRSTGFTWRVLMGNPVIWYCIGVLAVLQALFTYAPFMQTLFHTAPLGWTEWASVLVLSAGLFIAVEVEKAFAIAYERRIRAR